MTQGFEQRRERAFQVNEPGAGGLRGRRWREVVRCGAAVCAWRSREGRGRSSVRVLFKARRAALRRDAPLHTACSHVAVAARARVVSAGFWDARKAQ